MTDINIKDNVPTISFAPSGGATGGITRKDFNIADFIFTAFYDAAHKLIFVTDSTRDEIAPNVLLVINRDANNPDRKWDDILANDYGIDLESIRPKENNKYQKLDIEYNGLSIYNNLINTESADAAAELGEFRKTAAGNIANNRLAGAMDQIRKATDTIAETEISINTGHINVRELKDKLSKTKTKIGREPTKESAAKILKIQSKIELANDKLKRAELRLRRAHARLEDAESDAAAAREQLDKLGAESKITQTRVTGKPEPKAEIMADEVKPLFTKNPEIMDESIAFKPIVFEDVPAAPPPPPPPAPPPAPPVPEFVPPPAPPVLEPVAPVFVPPPAPPAAPVAPAPVPEPVVAPIAPAPMPTPAARPPSLTDAPMEPIAMPERQNPSFSYYVILAILIALSIFTLYLYQQRTTAPVPNIIAPIAAPAPAPVIAAPAPHVIEQPIMGDVIFFDEIEPHPMPTVEPIIVHEPGFQAVTTLPAELPADFNLGVFDNFPLEYADYDIPPYYTEQQMCEDGTPPDIFGCCTGEVITEMEDGFPACCPIGDDDALCFPPLS